MNTIENPGTPLEVTVTQEGLDRMPQGTKAGDRFPVKSITPGVCGDYWCAHVLDVKGNVWTLGNGQWQPAGAKKEKHTSK